LRPIDKSFDDEDEESMEYPEIEVNEEEDEYQRS
jgi:hypothetical protein